MAVLPMLGCRWFLPMVVEVCPALPLPAAGLPTVVGAKAGTAESVLVPGECQDAMSATWWETEWGERGIDKGGNFSVAVYLWGQNQLRLAQKPGEQKAPACWRSRERATSSN